MIYIFHKIADGHPGNENWNTPDQFRNFIKEKYEQVVSLADYLEFGRKGIVITFDGIYESVYQNAFPILALYKVPFEMFVVWSTIGQDNAWDRKEPLAHFATWPQIWEMQRSGLGLPQSHSFTHKALPDLTDTEMQKEIANHERSLPAVCLMPPVDFFAYPYGKFDARVEKAVKAVGYKGAVSVNRGDDTQFQLHREFLK